MNRVPFTWNAAAPWFLLMPALTLLTIFLVLPLAAAFLLSLTDFDIYALADWRNARFVGWQNYAALFPSPVFRQAVANTLTFALLAGPLSIGFSFVAALMLSAPRALGKGIFRTIYFAPVVTSLVASAVVWRYLFDARLGLWNQLLSTFGLPPVDWLGNPRTALPALVIMTVWKSFGYNLVIFLAGLQNIPSSLLEAAEVDGAGYLTRLRHIVIPSLAPTFVFVVVTSLVGYLQLFTEPYVMTEGGPLHSTYSLVMMMHEEGFRWWKLGQGAAIGLSLFVGMLLLTLTQHVWRPGWTR